MSGIEEIGAGGETSGDSLTNGSPTAVNASDGAVAESIEDISDEGYATLEKATGNGVAEKDVKASVAAPPPGRKKSLSLSTMDTDDRRSDEPTKLSFEKGAFPHNTPNALELYPVLSLQSRRTKKKQRNGYRSKQPLHRTTSALTWMCGRNSL